MSPRKFAPLSSRDLRLITCRLPPRVSVRLFVVLSERLNHLNLALEVSVLSDPVFQGIGAIFFVDRDHAGYGVIELG